MAMNIKVSTDHAALGRKLQASVRRYPRAAAAGINRAASGAFTLSVREIQADIGASSQKTIRRNLTIKRATGEQPVAELKAFSSKKDRIPIYEMKPKPKTVAKGRQRGQGVTYGPQRKLIAGAFIGRMQSGHIGAFLRASLVPGKAGQWMKNPGPRTWRPSKDEQPEAIFELRGPSVALVFSRKKITDKVQEFLHKKLPEEIARAFKFVTG